MEGHAPLYIRVQDYDDVIATIESVKRKLKDAQALLARLNDLKVEEDKELAAWTASLQDVSSKVSAIEKNLVSQ